MNIINTNWTWNEPLTSLGTVKYITQHHMAGTGTVQDIDREHKAQGWAGIGYHFFIDFNGQIFEGRPIDKLGAHTGGFNTGNIGICCEGNFEVTGQMNTKQFEALKSLIDYLKISYPNAQVKKHKDFMATACPGKNFPDYRYDLTESPTNTTSGVAGIDVPWEWLKRYQKAIGCKSIDGFSGPETLSLSPMLSKAINGAYESDIVRLYQEVLTNGYGCNTQGIDGLFGDNTVKATKQFQKNCGLSQDGICGPDTWKHILRLA